MGHSSFLTRGVTVAINKAKPRTMEPPKATAGGVPQKLATKPPCMLPRGCRLQVRLSYNGYQQSSPEQAIISITKDSEQWRPLERRQHWYLHGLAS
ncbi:MAG: hypothetical protein ABIJ44_06675 [Pseudomonadota bacterium]